MIDNITVYGCGHCSICGSPEYLYSPYHHAKFICDDCVKSLKEMRQTHKSNWIPNSKGGEPNNRKETR